MKRAYEMGPQGVPLFAARYDKLRACPALVRGLLGSRCLGLAQEMGPAE